MRLLPTNPGAVFGVPFLVCFGRGKKAVENASLRNELDEMEKREIELTRELHETREALVEAKAVGPTRSAGPAASLD